MATIRVPSGEMSMLSTPTGARTVLRSGQLWLPATSMPM
jgi:hypothetical protein